MTPKKPSSAPSSAPDSTPEDGPVEDEAALEEKKVPAPEPAIGPEEETEIPIPEPEPDEGSEEDTLLPIPEPEQGPREDVGTKIDLSPEELEKEKRYQRLLQVNNDMEGAIRQQETLEPPSRFREILMRFISPTMQKELGISIYTNTSTFTPKEKMRYFGILQRSKQYVMSHTNIILGFQLDAPIALAVQGMRKEYASDDNAVRSVCNAFCLEGDTPEDMNIKVESIKSVLIEMIEVVEKNLERQTRVFGYEETDYASISGLTPEKLSDDPDVRHTLTIRDHWEAMHEINKVPKLVNALPTDADFTPEAQAALFAFRVLIDQVQTDTGLTYAEAVLAEIGSLQESDILKLNRVVDVFNEAMAYCVQEGISAEEKNKRTETLVAYGKVLTQQMATGEGELLTYEQWIAQGAKASKSQGDPDALREGAKDDEEKGGEETSAPEESQETNRVLPAESVARIQREVQQYYQDYLVKHMTLEEEEGEGGNEGSETKEEEKQEELETRKAKISTKLVSGIRFAASQRGELTIEFDKETKDAIDKIQEKESIGTQVLDDLFPKEIVNGMDNKRSYQLKISTGDQESKKQLYAALEAMDIRVEEDTSISRPGFTSKKRS